MLGHKHDFAWVADKRFHVMKGNIKPLSGPLKERIWFVFKHDILKPI